MSEKINCCYIIFHSDVPIVLFSGHFIKTFETDPCTSSTGKVYSTAFVTILTKRRPGWFIANVFIPMAMFLVLSWLVFFYGDENFSEKNDVLMNIFLASFSNK